VCVVLFCESMKLWAMGELAEHKMKVLRAEGLQLLVASIVPESKRTLEKVKLFFGKLGQSLV